MLTKTSETALIALMYLAHGDPDNPVPPSLVAERLHASPTYLAKVCTLLVKSGLLRAHRGTKGGFTLASPPEDITLLQVVEACQGKILGDYCQEFDRVELVCAFHAAMHDLHTGIVSVLRRWTIADLTAKPHPSPELAGKVNCRLFPLWKAVSTASSDR